MGRLPTDFTGTLLLPGCSRDRSCCEQPVLLLPKLRVLGYLKEEKDRKIGGTLWASPSKKFSTTSMHLFSHKSPCFLVEIANSNRRGLLKNAPFCMLYGHHVTLCTIVQLPATPCNTLQRLYTLLHSLPVATTTVTPCTIL